MGRDSPASELGLSILYSILLPPQPNKVLGIGLSQGFVHARKVFYQSSYFLQESDLSRVGQACQGGIIHMNSKELAQQ